MDAYRIRHVNTGMVLAASSTVAGAKLHITPETGGRDELWLLDWVNGGPVWNENLAAAGMAINVHSKTGEAILWPRAAATAEDSLTDTKTENGNQQIYLAEQADKWLTATSEEKGAVVVFALKCNDSSQYWCYEKVALAGKDLQISPISQQSYSAYSQAFRNNGCLAANLEMAAVHHGNRITIDDLVAKGCVNNNANLYINGKKIPLGYVLNPAPFISWVATGENANEAAASAAICADIDQGNPPSVKLTLNGNDHWVLATAYTSADFDGITVNDPTDGKRRTLRAAIQKHGKKYSYFRACKKG